MFIVEMHDWMFQRAIEDGCFWLRRNGRYYLIQLACFKIQAYAFKDGWHVLGFWLKEGDQWGRIMYWRLIHGESPSQANHRQNRAAGVVTV